MRTVNISASITCKHFVCILNQRRPQRTCCKQLPLVLLRMINIFRYIWLIVFMPYIPYCINCGTVIFNDNNITVFKSLLDIKRRINCCYGIISRLGNILIDFVLFFCYHIHFTFLMSLRFFFLPFPIFNLDTILVFNLCSINRFAFRIIFFPQKTKHWNTDKDYCYESHHSFVDYLSQHLLGSCQLRR